MNCQTAAALDQQRLVRNAGAAWEATHFSALGKATRADYKRALEEFVAEFGSDDIGALKRGQLIRHLDEIKARSSTAANRATVVIRLLFAFARDRYDTLEQNPASDSKNPSKQANARARLTVRKSGCCGKPARWRATRTATPRGSPCAPAASAKSARSSAATSTRPAPTGSKRTTSPSAGSTSSLAKHAKAILDDCPNHGRHAPFFSASADARGHARPLRSDGWNNALSRHVAPQIEAAAEKLGLDAIDSWTPHDLRRTVRAA